MAHNLTEADSFDANITVPDGTDSMNTAAEQLAVFAQQLANRTKNLNLHGAKKTSGNVFTAAPQEVNQTDASLAAFLSRDTADQDAHGGNLWKAFLGANIGDSGGYMLTYAGMRTGPGQYIQTINAVWDTVNQWWVPDNTALDSFALLYDVTLGVTVYRRPAGAGHWTAWPTTSGHLTANGNLNAGNNVVAGGQVIAATGATITTGSLSMLNGEVLYVPVIARTKELDLTTGVGFVPASSDEYTSDSGFTVAVPITLPFGCVITGVDVVAKQSSAVVSAFTLVKRHVNYSTPATPSITSIASATTTTSTAYQTLSIAGGSLPVTIVKTADAYYVQWSAGVNGGAGDRVIGIRVNYNDPGPRN
jgi:hypothetical protein